MQADELVVSCYGVALRLVDAAGLDLCQRLREVLPPEFVAPAEAPEAAVTYEVSAVDAPDSSKPGAYYAVTCDGVAVFASLLDDEVFGWLREDIDRTVARRSPDMLFVHAGVVGWRGVGIVIPGRESVGKSALVAELVRRGAVYYSDTFAVLDAAGRVHPYRCPMGSDDDDQPQDLRLIREDGSSEPVPVNLIVAGPYQPAHRWQPAIVRGPHAALPLVDSTVVPRDDAPHLQQIVERVGATAVALRGPRSEAVEVALHLLDLVDDALVSRALDVAGDGLSRLPDEMARVAEARLWTEYGRIVSPPRQLVAARFVRITDFLSPAERDRMLACALAWEQDFTESGIVGAAGEGKVDHGSRKSRTLTSGRLEELWDMFDQPIRAMLPVIRQKLGVPWFQLGKIERQLTAHGRGGFFVPHVDTGDPSVEARRVSAVYYFHQLPKRFSGGELKMYDTWVTPTGSTGAGTYTTLTPIDNSLVFFPSDAFHEVCPVFPETDDFADSRFAITMWFWEADPPAPA